MFRALLCPSSGARDWLQHVAHNTLFKAGRVFCCGVVGYASGLRDVARLSRHCVASSWNLSLHTSHLLFGATRQLFMKTTVAHSLLFTCTVVLFPFLSQQWQQCTLCSNIFQPTSFLGVFWLHVHVFVTSPWMLTSCIQLNIHCYTRSDTNKFLSMSPSTCHGSLSYVQTFFFASLS